MKDIQFKKAMMLCFIVASLSLVAGCMPIKPDFEKSKVNLEYNGIQNVFPKVLMFSKNGDYAFAYRDYKYEDNKLGKLVNYKNKRNLDMNITVFIYPNYLTDAHNINEAIEKNILDMIYFIKKKNPQLKLLTRNEKNIIKKGIAYNRITINKKIHEHIYMTRIHGQVVKFRITTAADNSFIDMSNIFVANTVLYLKNRLNNKKI